MKLPRWFVVLPFDMKAGLAIAAVLAALTVSLEVKHVLDAPQKAAEAKVVAKAATVQAEAENAVSASQAKVYDHAQTREASVLHIQLENRRVIQSLPSAQTGVLSVADSDTWKSGLCVYHSAASDPECARLQQGHP